MTELGRVHAGLPDDLLNFQYDPVGLRRRPRLVRERPVTEMRLRPVLDGHVLRFEPDAGGRLVRVVVDLDGAAFSDVWLSAVEAAHR